MIVSEYCHRIGLVSLPPATPDGLAALQHAQRQTIPFENLDICLNSEIRIEPEAVFGKLVREKRGGYCFEQNILLASALTAMGVSNRPILARVWLGATEMPPVTHLVLLAEIDGENWLMDAGFGAGYCPPLRLSNGAQSASSDGSVHRLTRGDASLWILEQMLQGTFVRQYSFALTEVFPADIRLSNHWTSTHPTSRFRQNVIVNRITGDGRISLMNRMLTRTGETEEAICVESAGQLAAILEREFGLGFSEAEISVLARQIGV